MKTDKSQSNVLGILFIAVMVTWAFGFALISPIINIPDFLSHINERRFTLITGTLFEFVEILCVIGIIVTVFPIMKKYNERFALWYSSIRILEASTLLIIALISVFLIPLSNLYTDATSSEIPALENIGRFMVLIREKWVGLPISIFYSTSALVFQYFLFKTSLVPKFISVWGIISAILVLVVAPFELLGYDNLGFVGISMGVNEIFLGGWLIIKGFNSGNVNMDSTKTFKQAAYSCI